MGEIFILKKTETIYSFKFKILQREIKVEMKLL